MNHEVCITGNRVDPIYFIVGSILQDDIIDVNKPFNGSSGRMFRRLLSDLHFTPENTLMVSIGLTKDENQSRNLIDSCFIDLLSCEPKILLTVGYLATKYISSDIRHIALSRSILKEILWISQPYDKDAFDDRYNKWMYNLSTYSPYYVYHKTGELGESVKSQFSFDLKSFYQFGQMIKNNIYLIGV